MLLPLGLVMRAFPFFRATGSSIIALSFALYFVLPFAIILSNYLIFDIYQPADFVYTPSRRASSAPTSTNGHAEQVDRRPRLKAEDSSPVPDPGPVDRA